LVAPTASEPSGANSTPLVGVALPVAETKLKLKYVSMEIKLAGIWLLTTTPVAAEGPALLTVMK
jgi:hypothetical protein